jgi:hypothetical protein
MYIVDLVDSKTRNDNGWEWRVVALSKSSSIADSFLYRYLKNLHSDELDGIYALFRLACEKGPNGLPAKTRHEMDSENGIFEFIKGRHRIAWFYDSGKLVICTEGFFKDTQKTKKSDQKAALKSMNEYRAAKKDGQLNDIKG